MEGLSMKVNKSSTMIMLPCHM